MFYEHIESALNLALASLNVVPLWLQVIGIWLLCWWVLTRLMRKHALIASIFLMLTLSIYVYLALMGWVLRDGLGPGAIESHGEVAVKRFIPMLAFAAASALPTFLIFAVIFYKNRIPSPEIE